jgi:hypothetical protein
MLNSRSDVMAIGCKVTDFWVMTSYRYALPCVLVTIDGFWIGVTTNDYNTIADFYTTNHSTLSFLNLNDGYFSALFSLEVFW